MTTPLNAADVAAYAHAGQRRPTGEAYITHPAVVARTVADLMGDSFTLEDRTSIINAAWLHDTVEDRETRLREALTRSRTFNSSEEEEVNTSTHLAHAFGEETARLVLAVTNPVGNPTWTTEQKNTAYRKHLLETLVYRLDRNVFLLKLSDFSHNAGNLKPDMTKLHRKYSSALPIFWAAYAVNYQTFTAEEQNRIEQLLDSLGEKLKTEPSTDKTEN